MIARSRIPLRLPRLPTNFGKTEVARMGHRKKIGSARKKNWKAGRLAAWLRCDKPNI